MIFFNVKEVKDFLLKNGEVYTTRKPSRKTGIDIAVEGSYTRPKILGLVDIKFVELITQPEQLTLYVNRSGLHSPFVWFEKAQELHKLKTLGLFHVKLLDTKQKILEKLATID